MAAAALAAVVRQRVPGRRAVLAVARWMSVAARWRLVAARYLLAAAQW